MEILGHSPQIEHGDLPVLIVAFRSAALLEKCLDSVKRHHPEQDVLIWDNSGSDGNEVRELAGRYPYFTWYFSHRNIGFAAAVNLLANMVPGRDFLLLNPDAELIAPLEKTVAALREPKVAAAGPMHFVADSPGARIRRLAILRPTEMAWDNCIRRLTLLNVLGVAAGLGKHLRGSPLSRSYRSAPTEVDGYIAGFCLAIRREAWDELGGFDEEFFLYSEDSEWPRRAANAGWKIRLAHEVAVRHLGQGTVTGDKALSRRSLDLNYSSLALETEYIYSVRLAEFVLVWYYVFDSIKRHIRGETSVSRPGADFLVTVATNGRNQLPISTVDSVLSLEKAGYRVTVVSLQPLGVLPRELPASIRLVRLPWWWPWIPNEKPPAKIISGPTAKERAFSHLLRLRVAISRSAPKVLTSERKEFE